MDTEQSMKQNSEFSGGLLCQVAEKIVFCKILHIFANSLQFLKKVLQSQNPIGACVCAQCHELCVW